MAGRRAAPDEARAEARIEVPEPLAVRGTDLLRGGGEREEQRDEQGRAARRIVRIGEGAREPAAPAVRGPARPRAAFRSGAERARHGA